MGKEVVAAAPSGGSGLRAFALLLVPLVLFMGFKALLNTDALGTDSVVVMDAARLKDMDGSLVHSPPFKVFGDLTDGMYPVGKVYEDGRWLGPSADWYWDLVEQGGGRTYFHEHTVLFTTPDNSSPRVNGRTYAVGYNPLALLNADWAAAGLFVLVWFCLGRLKDNASADRLRHAPDLWLGLFLVDRFVTLVSSPNFALCAVPDSGSYTSLASSLGSLHALLSSFRTVGYPAFYAIVPDALIPPLQLALFLLGVYVVYLGLRSLSSEGWTPLAACLSMAVIAGTYRLDAIAYAHLLIPDSLALSMSLLAVGACLRLLGDARRRGWWLSLCGLAVFFACQLKPSYLFLVVAIPGMALGWTVLCRLSRWREALRSVVLPLLLVVLLPLVAFCGLRLAVVGQFSLSSAGGRQLVGLAGNFLDAATAERVREDLRPMARDLAAMVRGKSALAGERLRGDALYRHVFRTYDLIIYGKGELARYCAGPACDRRLGELSRQVLALHFGRYADWVRTAAFDAASRVALLGRWRTVVLGGLGAALAVFLAALVRAGKAVGIGRGLRGLFRCDLRMAAWTFVCLFIPSLLVVLLVAIPYSRYLLPARILFLPLCLYFAGCLLREGVRLWRAMPGK